MDILEFLVHIDDINIFTKELELFQDYSQVVFGWIDCFHSCTRFIDWLLFFHLFWIKLMNLHYGFEYISLDVGG